MTTYSHAVNRPVAMTEPRRFSVHGLNYFLLILAVFSVLSYIFLANFFVAQKYQISSGKKQLNSLAAEAIGKDHDSSLDLNELLLFAHKSGMIESKDADSIMRDGGFALTPSNY